VQHLEPDSRKDLFGTDNAAHLIVDAAGNVIGVSVEGAAALDYSQRGVEVPETTLIFRSPEKQ